MKKYGSKITRHTSIIVPLVIIPSCVYVGDCGFFLTLRISSWNVAFSSGWQTCAFLKRRPVGLIKRSYLGFLRVNVSPTKQAFVIIRFHCLAALVLVNCLLFHNTWFRPSLHTEDTQTKNFVVRTEYILLRFPVRNTLKISSSAIGLTLGTGTSHLPAFSFLFCLTVLLRTYMQH